MNINAIIKSPKRSGETYCVAPFLLLLLFAQILSRRLDFSVTTGRIVLQFGDMVDMIVKLCERVSKFKMMDSKADTWACPKPQKFCLDYISLTTEGIVLKCF